jgi:hypothetical protein
MTDKVGLLKADGQTDRQMKTDRVIIQLLEVKARVARLSYTTIFYKPP